MRVQIDLTVPRLAKRASTVILFVLVCGAGVAIAAPKYTFRPGQPLSSKELNETVSDLDVRLGKLEAAPRAARVCTGAFTATKGIGCTVASDATQCLSSCRFIDITGGGSAEFDIRPGTFTKMPTCVASVTSVDGTWLSAGANSPVLGTVRFGPTSGGVAIYVVCVEAP